MKDIKKLLQPGCCFQKDLHWRFLCLLCMFVLTVCISASIFQAIENTAKGASVPSREEVIKEFSTKQNISVDSIESFLKKLKNTPKRTMSFVEGFVLTISLFFTIGWGHVTPVTMLGHLFTVFVSILGIPLTFILVVTGGRIVIKHVDDLVRISMSHHNEPVNRYIQLKMRINTKQWITPTLIFTLILYVLSIAAIHAKMDNFAYHHAIYYTFNSLSTVGFGDFVQSNMLEETHPGKVLGHCLFLVIWVLFGLILATAIVLQLTRSRERKLVHCVDEHTHMNTDHNVAESEAL